ncbi:hypothetical protein EUX98_g7919 [Antrodiella citrinella]|uniref:Uncharacterized protein n=1 Tax=Antrodiella citrinella TaxID=2447956 RepID=A0A4S4MCN3_9APHY|nr:hypothetical protein EUX98_g7919 [Antrodiella citrinella]
MSLETLYSQASIQCYPVKISAEIDEKMRQDHPVARLPLRDGFQLYSCSMSETLLESQTIDISGVLYAGRKSTVYAGVCNYGGKPLEIALKFAKIEQNRPEVEAYNKLFVLQGKTIPKLYGMLCSDEVGDNVINCLILERFGKPLDLPFCFLPREDLAQILDHVKAIHALGVRHDDFAERNVLVDSDGQYRITDLTLLPHKDEKCGWTYVFKDHVDPKYEDINTEAESSHCEEINSLASSMGFWDRGWLSLNRGAYFVRKDEVPGMPPQYIINNITELRLNICPEYTADDFEALTILFYQEVQKLMATHGQTVEQIKRDKNLIAYSLHKPYMKMFFKDTPFRPTLVPTSDGCNWVYHIEDGYEELLQLLNERLEERNQLGL